MVASCMSPGAGEPDARAITPSRLSCLMERTALSRPDLARQSPSTRRIIASREAEIPSSMRDINLNDAKWLCGHRLEICGERRHGEVQHRQVRPVEDARQREDGESYPLAMRRRRRRCDQVEAVRSKNHSQLGCHVASLSEE